MAHIHKIGIKNFRIFKEYSECDIAPITILTGPNNSGKSTLIRALKLLEESANHSGFYNLIPKNTETEYYTNDILIPANANTDAKKFVFLLNIENTGNNHILLPDFFQVKLEFAMNTDKSADLILCSIQVVDLQNGKELIKYFSTFHEFGLKESIDRFGISDEFEKRESDVIDSEIKIIKSVAEIFNQKIIYLPISRISQRREFTRRDTDFLSKKLFAIEDGDLKIFNSSQKETLNGGFSYNPEFIKTKAKREFVFTNDMINSLFSLGQHVLFLPNNHLGNYELFLHTYDDKLINIADLGYGVSNLITLLLSIDIAAADYQGTQFSFTRVKGEKESRKVLSKEHKFSEKLILIEEPELNLHPNFQAKLADLFSTAYKKMGIHFIIETHSEYFIRKLQYLTAKKEISPADTSVYYFDNPAKVPVGEKQIRKIDILENGRLSSNFGTGFLDEAAILLELTIKASLN